MDQDKEKVGDADIVATAERVRLEAKLRRQEMSEDAAAADKDKVKAT